jgi:predicted PurR-regulated permease PerM
MGIFNFDDRNNPRAYDISWAAIFKIALALAIGYAVYLARDILLLTLFGLIISVLFNPAINFLQKFKISRTAATLLAYSLVLGVLAAMIYLIAPVFMIETQQLGQLFPVYFQKVAPFLSGLGFVIFQSMDAFVAAIRDWLVGASSSIIGSIASLFGGILLTITVFTIAIFFSLEEKGIERTILLVVPKKHEKAALEWWQKAQVKISGWFAVRFTGMLAVGLLTALACWALGIRYPIFLGFIAGVADIIPFIGPLVAGVFLALAALLDSWQKALFIVAVFTFIQQVENNLMIPLLTKKFIEFPAILVLVSILVGNALWGVAGAILAIPLFGVLYDFVKDYLIKSKT